MLVSREATVPTGVAIAVVRHEVSGSAPFTERKQPYEFLSLNFVTGENPLLLFGLRLVRFFVHLTIPPFPQAFVEEHS